MKMPMAIAGRFGLLSLMGFAALTQAAESRDPTAKIASNWKAPRTPEGQPDLQGMWTDGTLTPMERAAGFDGKDLFTAEDASTIEKQAAKWRANITEKPEIGHDNEAFMDAGYKVIPTMQTSLVVDPATGKIPLRPEAERKRDFNLLNFDSYESMSPWDRCITRGPTGLLPAAYNNAYQIIQTPRYVVIVAEMIHEARVIPLGAQPHIDARVKSWVGDSRGHWEGNTLVVDTANFNNKGWIATHNGAGRIRGVPHSEALHMVERFTRVSSNTINYQITVDDPQEFSAPWTAALPFTRDDSYQMFEYACHEGNTATEMILRGARVQEKTAAK